MAAKQQRAKKQHTLPPNGAEVFVQLRQIEQALACSRATLSKIRDGYYQLPIDFPKEHKLAYGLRFWWPDVQEFIRALAELGPQHLRPRSSDEGQRVA